MGLLDWKDDAVDDFALPDYNFGFGYPTGSRPGSSGQSTDTSSTRDNGSCAQLEKVTSNSSSMGSDDTSYDPATASSPRPAISNRAEPSRAKASQRRHTTASSSNNPPARAPQSSYSTTTMSSSKGRHRRRSSATSMAWTQPKRTFSFDLYHEDEELQEAEPKITFCDICKKPCEVH